MKFKINQKDLLTHINLAQKAVSSRTTIQILEGILFTAKDDTLRLIASDLELVIDTKVPCQVLEDGQIVINANMIANIVRKLPYDSDIYVNVVDDNINIKCQSSEFNIKGQDPADFPSLPYIDESKDFTLDQKSLKDAIRKTSFAVSLDQTRPDLTGVLFNILEEKIEFVGLDGYRVTRYELEEKTGFTDKAIVPSRSLNELMKILDQGEVKVSLISGNIIFKFEDTEIYSRLIEGQYIDYNQVLSQGYSTSVTLDTRSFQEAIERASLMAKEDKANLVKLNFSNNQVHISSNTEIGRVDEYVNCELGGKDIRIAFNAKYLLDGLRVIDDEDLSLYMSGSLKPLIFKPLNSTEYTYLVLPVKLAGEDND